MASPNIQFHYRSPLFKLSPLKKYVGIVLGRHVFFKDAEEDVPAELLAHELVHQAQMTRFGVMGFYVLYVWYYLLGLIKFRNHDFAYMSNPLEVEAYEKQASHARIIARFKDGTLDA